MKRYDLRELKNNFTERMIDMINNGVEAGESAVFIFEISDFSSVQRSAEAIKESGFELLNSLKYNEVDWMHVVRKTGG
ncbi:MAG: NADH-ubiquinone oxidoreductase subunit E family protein [Helicobacteraceae bacterium]|jgi:NADH-quinone oxidoreductase subunit E|nr:NADH-ubiquinone oxidoreductase subunit E family protein [Helicobacteraceae bacterium]